jgi:hypothetical protein
MLERPGRDSFHSSNNMMERRIIRRCNKRWPCSNTLDAADDELLLLVLLVTSRAFTTTLATFAHGDNKQYL